MSAAATLAIFDRARGAFAQTPLTIPLAGGAGVCAALPIVGGVNVAGIAVTINGTKFVACSATRPLPPRLSVGVANNSANGGACTIELAGGITIEAEVALQAASGVPVQNYGELGFVQFAQYTHQRSPAGLGPGVKANFACARSSGGWELDSPYRNQSYNGFSSCANGVNTVRMSDDPGVAAEDAATSYDTLFVGPTGQIIAPDRFRTWLIWNETDDNKPVTATNAARRRVLARVDWEWRGKAGDRHAPGAACASLLHPGHGWDTRNLNAGVTGVLFGAAAGAPPKKFMRTHNNAWVAGAC